METIQTFENGIHSDNDPLYQPAGTIRALSDGNIISNGGNSYSIETLLGTKVSFRLTDNNYHDPSRHAFVPISYFDFVDRLIVFSTDNESVGGLTSPSGEWGQVMFDNQGNGTYTPLYYHPDLRLTKRNRLDGYVIDENDNVKRVYFTDNNTPPRSINVKKSSFNTLVASGSLMNGTTYMVVGGKITYSATDYAPSHSNGNVFTASATTTYTTVSGTPRVIVYVPVNTFNIFPNAGMGEIDFLNYHQTGNLWCGSKCYLFRLRTTDGAQSDWSVVSLPIFVTNGVPVATTVGYQAYQGNGVVVGVPTLVNSGKSLDLSISNIDTSWDFIDVAVVEYDLFYNTIRNIEIFYKSNIIASTMTVTHYGQENLAKLTVNDINTLIPVVLQAKTMCTLKARGIIANVTERAEVDVAFNSFTATALWKKRPSDATGFNSGVSADSWAWGQAQIGTSIASGSLLPDMEYKVTGTGGDTITYNDGTGAIVYNVGDVFQTTYNHLTYTHTGTGSVCPCIRIKKYDKFGGGSVYKDILVQNDYFDYKGMFTSHYLGGHWRTETYRIGILYFDANRQPFFVRWGADYTMPGQTSTIIGSDGAAGVPLLNVHADATCSINIAGLKVSVTIPAAVAQKASGFAIVRVPRDKVVLFQGMLFPAVIDKTANTDRPLATTRLDYDESAVTNHLLGNNGAQPQLFTINSPELDANLFTLDKVTTGDLVVPAAEITPEVDLGGADAFIDAGAYLLYSKYFLHNDYTGPNGSPFNVMQFGVASTPLLYNGSRLFKNRDIETDGGHPIVGAGYGNGGLEYLIQIQTADNGQFLNPATGLRLTDYSTSNKLLCNYTRPKAAKALYGGNSDAAKANNNYVYVGHYQELNAQSLADTINGSGDYEFNNIEVFGGDCFLNLYDRLRTMKDAPNNPGAYNDYAFGIIYPVESNINVALRQGVHFGLFFPAMAVNAFHEDFTYNSAYSSMNDLSFDFPSLPLNFTNSNRHPYRARWSQPKISGESIDSMRNYKLNDYVEAEGEYGEINNIRGRSDRVFYWQNRGVGYFPMLERAMTSSSVGVAVQLGVGGIMDRSDVVDKFFGNQHQWGLFETPDGWGWFDMRRRSLMKLFYSGAEAEYSVIKGLQSYFNNAFNAVEGVVSPNIFDSDMPIMGAGINGYYDHRYEMAFMTFKLDFETDLQSNIERSFTIGLSKQLDKFTLNVGFKPGVAISFNRNFISSDTKHKEIENSTAYIAGTQLTDGDINYVCILDYTSAGSATIPSADSTHWAATNSINEVHVHWRGDYNKYYGKVWDLIIQLVLKGNDPDEKVFNTIEAYGDPAFFDHVQYNCDGLTSQDMFIKGTQFNLATATPNRNYKYYDRKLWGNIPFAVGHQRLVSAACIVTLTKLMYTPTIVGGVVTKDYTTSLNILKRLVNLKHTYRHIT